MRLLKALHAITLSLIGMPFFVLADEKPNIVIIPVSYTHLTLPTILLV